MTLHDWRLVPVAAGAWGGAFAGTSGDGVTTVLVAVVSVPAYVRRIFLP